MISFTIVQQQLHGLGVFLKGGKMQRRESVRVLRRQLKQICYKKNRSMEANMGVIMRKQTLRQKYTCHTCTSDGAICSSRHIHIFTCIYTFSHINIFIHIYTKQAHSPYPHIGRRIVRKQTLDTVIGAAQGGHV